MSATCLSFQYLAACIDHGGCKNGGRCGHGGHCKCKPGFKGKRCHLVNVVQLKPTEDQENGKLH